MKEYLENIEFDEKVNYGDLADSLEHWADCFYKGLVEDQHGDNIAYLLYEMSKEMRKVHEASI